MEERQRSMKPTYTATNRDEYNNHYVATIRIGTKRKVWSSYDLEHLNWRIDQAGLRPFVTGWHIEDADHRANYR